MARQSFVQINKKLYDKSLPLPPEAQEATCGSRERGVGFIPDIPDFVSPIDGEVVSGRRALREHCARHDVVPTQELKGLPEARPGYTQTRQDREQIRQLVARQIYK